MMNNKEAHPQQTVERSEGMTSGEVKKIAFGLGAELCGIASAESFGGAPEGFRPRDILPACRSVISFACRFPAGTLACASPVCYTRARNSLTDRMDALALDLCIELEKRGALAAPVPANESLLDEKTNRWRSILSQKHAAEAAGLGRIGRNTQLITPELGNMVWLGCVLTDLELLPDKPRPALCDGCGLCVAACPVNALENMEMDQQACWDHAFGENAKTKNWEISCHRCRDVCPHHLGGWNGRPER